MRIESRVKILIVAYAILGMFIIMAAVTAFIPNSTQADNTVSVKSEPRFMVRDYNGRIAVFASGSSDPFRIYDVYTSTLPQADRTALLAGIAVEDVETLRRIIEDYTS